MPEWSEVRLSVDYINSISEKNTWVKCTISESCKIKTDLSIIPGIFTIEAESRGKEMRLKISGVDKYLSFSLGMSGYWIFKPKIFKPQEIHKHARIWFETPSGGTLSLIDTRKFAKWSWVEDWSKTRGPDPIYDLINFRNNILENYGHKDFNNSLPSCLMNQKWFSGIGNYLRAEIIERLGIENPFISLNSFLETQIGIDKFFKVIEITILESYMLGGGQIKNWINPYGQIKIPFNEWIQVYGKSESLIDESGRRFWYNKRYQVWADKFTKELNDRNFKKKIGK